MGNHSRKPISDYGPDEIVWRVGPFKGAWKIYRLYERVHSREDVKATRDYEKHVVSLAHKCRENHIRKRYRNYP
jgi:hypothetical protein